MAARDWNAAVGQVHSDIPGISELDWEGLFKADPKILGSVINDIIKVSVSKKGRPGKRSVDSEGQITQDLGQLRNDDYSILPFIEVMQILMRGRSIRQVANASGLDKMVVHRLMSGKGQPPTAEHMEALAKAFKKSPTHFAEYRAMYICNVLYEVLVDNGESSVVFLNKIKGINVGT